MKIDQSKGLLRQFEALLLQVCGHTLRDEKYIAKGSTLRQRGYIRASHGSTVKMGQRRMRQWPVAALTSHGPATGPA